MNVVDSSGWLEHFTNGPNARFFQDPLNDIESLVVPAIVIYEIFKVVARERGEQDALQAVAPMLKANVVEIGPEIAVSAAKISHAHSLPMADSMILASARLHNATIWTQDADFKGLPNVRFVRKK